MKRISVVGTSGSGKTTIAGKIAGILRVPHIELDALRFGAEWVEAPDELFRSRVREAVGADRWVVDGNYGKKVRDLVWDRADTVIWLDFSFPVTLNRLLRRTIRRIVTGEECCNGNREKLRQALSRDSIILWALKTYGRRRREYPPLLASVQRKGVQTIRLASPREADRWLSELTPEGE
jgi:adenylate kinase family enzyme